jgi:endoglucanase
MPFSYQPKWDLINQVYHRVVTAIREIDPDHIIFLEGDQFSRRFSQLDPPFVPNLVYSSHNYNEAGFGPGKYPGICHDRHWDIDTQRQVFEEQEGTQFTRQHNVPLWVGEFGGTYNGPAAEIPDRLRAMDDQMAVFNQAGIHWTNWVYKDIHVMGMVQPAADSAYIQRIRRILDAKKTLATDFWMGWIAPTEIRQKVWNLADLIGEEVDNPEVDPRANHTYLSQAVLSVYTAGLLQPVYAHCFEGLSETQLDEILQSWTFANCRPHQALVDLLQKRWNE